MHITIIAAMDKNNCIGQTDGHKGLPWHLPGDMIHFREKTRGKPMVFGRKTFKAFGERPLPKRPNIVVTRDENYHVEGVHIVHSLPEAIALARKFLAEEIIIGGGSEIYRQVLEAGLATRMILTEIDLEVEGDAFFPSFDKEVWVEVSREPQKEEGISYDFVVYEQQQ